MGIGVLGPITIDGEADALAPRDRVVLAALVVRRGDVVRAGTLADALWGADPPATWGKQVQASVVRLRRALGQGAIETSSGGYRLVLPADEIDAHRFERLLVRGRELNAQGESERAVYVIGEALALWRGPALTDLDGWDQGRIEASRLDELRLDAEDVGLDATLRAGRFREVLADAQARVAEVPLREHRWVLLALAQYQAGRQADALQTLRRARQVLVSELGLDPGPDLVAMEEAILRQDPSVAAAAALPEPSATCPYLGLVPYDVADADAFFGRDAEVSECLRRLAGAGVLTVVGPSGSGKSSLIRAGVAAALERDGRRVVVLTPGAHPINAMSVLPRSGPAALVVDQCEEAVTQCADPAERAQFFATLVAHAEHAPLIVALRADRLGEVSAYPAFARLIERGLYLLKAMDEDDLRAAVEGPAGQAGLLLEPGLVDLLVRDVEGEPGALPLLSHALRQTWTRREGRTLTVGGYLASGGIRGAVAQSAEQVYEQAAEEQRPVLRDLLLRLVAPSPEGEPVRSRVPRRVVAADPEHEQMIEQLVRARLVTSDEDVVELAHEALARAWPRLRSWLDDDVEGQRILRHVSLSADTWDAMGRPDSELYRGARLAQAIEWRQRAVPDLNPVERAFLDAGQRHHEVESTAARRRRRTMVAALATVAMVTTTLAGVAFVSQQRAGTEADRADRAADLARSRELAAAAIAVLDDDPSLSKLLAVASATAAEPTVESIAAMHRAWAADLSAFRHGSVFDMGLNWVDIDPSGATMVTSGTFPVEGSDQTVEVVDLASGRSTWVMQLDEASAFVGSPRFASDGRHVVAGVFWDPYNVRRYPAPLDHAAGIDEPRADLLGAHVWDAVSGELVERFDIGRCGGLVTGMSETHLLVRTLHGTRDVLDACRWADGTMGAELVDMTTGERRVLAADSGGFLWGAAMSADGHYVAFDDASPDRVVVAEVESGAPVLEVDGGGVRDLNDDGTLLLAGDDPIRVWDVFASDEIAAFAGHAGQSLFAGFDSSGRTVLSTGADGTVREWDATTGRELWAYAGVGNGRPSATAGGLVLVSDPDSDTAVLLDTGARGEVGIVGTCPGFVPADSLEIAAGLAVVHVICTGDLEGTTHIVDAVNRELLYVLPGHQAQALSVSPDGSRFIRQEGNGAVHGPLAVRDVRTGELLVELDGLCAWDEASPLPAGRQDGCREYPEQPFGIWADRVIWSPDGSLIASAAGGALVVWDAVTGRLLFAEQPDSGRLHTVDLMFTADSAALQASSGDRTVRTLSTQSWEVIDIMPGGFELGLFGYTPDGSTALVARGFLANTGAALHWFDADAREVVRTVDPIHDGALRSVAVSQDWSLIATASSDGFVRVWDFETGDLAHEIPFGSVQLQGVAFVDDQHLVVTPETGDLLFVTIDPGELLDLVRSSLTRGFTTTECARYNFADDCPTLAELRGVPPGSDDPSVLDGEYQVEWTADDLLAGLAAAGLPEYRPDGHPIENWAGTYTAILAGGRFDIVRDGTAITFCTGSYAVHGNRVRFLAERAEAADIREACFAGRTFLDAAFELADRELRLADPHAGLVDTLLFTSRPLERTG